MSKRYRQPFIARRKRCEASVRQLNDRGISTRLIAAYVGVNSVTLTRWLDTEGGVDTMDERDIKLMERGIRKAAKEERVA